MMKAMNTVSGMNTPTAMKKKMATKTVRKNEHGQGDEVGEDDDGVEDHAHDEDAQGDCAAAEALEGRALSTQRSSGQHAESSGTSAISQPATRDLLLA